MPLTRDPVSVLFDGGARRLLARAYAHPGQWAGTLLKNPEARHVAHFASLGIDVLGPDTQPGREARTRWARGFTRSLYYQHKWWSGTGGQGWRGEKRRVARATGGLVVEVGVAKRAVGVIPAGRSVRVKLVSGGKAKVKAVDQTPEAEQWRDHGPRYADARRRDWG